MLGIQAGKRRLLWFALAAAATVLVALVAVSLFLLDPARVRSIAVTGLSKHLHLDTRIDQVSVSLWPRWRIAGTGLTLRIPNRPDLPPFISIDRFSMDVGLLSMWRK